MYNVLFSDVQIGYHNGILKNQSTDTYVKILFLSLICAIYSLGTCDNIAFFGKKLP